MQYANKLNCFKWFHGKVKISAIMSPSLHHVSGQESKLHMNIRSENFLVDENNKVKVPSAQGFFFKETLSHFSCCSFFFPAGGFRTLPNGAVTEKTKRAGTQ